MEIQKSQRKGKRFSNQIKAFEENLSREEEVPKTRFILMIVANTLDPTIGKGCLADIKSMRHIFKRLCRAMDFNFIELVVRGKDYKKENIEDCIHLLKPGANDIVVFYYSGHGFSYEHDAAKKFPQVDLRPFPSSENIDVINAHTENLADLFELVKSKGARLNIVIGDCCNSLIDFRRSYNRATKDFRTDKRGRVIINKNSCEVLFCDYTASILVGSASKGEYAVSDDTLGSLFTYNFSESLKGIMKKKIDKSEGLPWKPLLEEVKEKTNALSKTYDIGDGVPGNQEAIFEIHFRENLY